MGKWKFCAFLAALIVTVAIPALCAPQDDGSAAKVASVNGEQITRADLDREMIRVRQQFIQMGKPLDEARLADVRTQVLERLINRELLYQESRKTGIAVEDARVEGELDALKGKFPSEDEFKKALGKSGLSESLLRLQIRKSVAVQEFISREFVGKTVISDEEMKAYYDGNQDKFSRPEQVHAGHILILVDPSSDPSEKSAAREKIEAIRERLKKGEDFETLAKENSQCPSSAKGGDLGFFGRGQMVKPFEDAAFALAPGETSDIIETKFGYHIVRVIEKTPAGTMGFEEAKPPLRKVLKEKKVVEGLSRYLERLKEKAAVERFLAEDPG
ncbi:MAG: peptidylprolyl isomerase [Deltaproteobacteria bacterium]|nr:peptidylprolyl isomerase [Deltaproteobacteria bacterium]